MMTSKPLKTLATVVTVLCAFGVNAPALARDGVDVGDNSAFTNLVSAEQVERSAAEQYAKMLQQAAAKNALAPKDNAQVKRLRVIAARIIQRMEPPGKKLALGG